MCGIVGLISKKVGGFFGSDLDMFQALLVNDSQRGEDSTGAFVVRSNGSVQTIKVASHPFHLFATDGWDKFRSDVVQRGRIVVGHNRKATQGKINSQNAHPFAENHIVLVHNGTLFNHRELSTDKEVDSHAICQAFSEKDAEEVLPTLNGAFALVWYDLAKERLFLIRNDERPLALVETESMIAIASESWMAMGQFMRKNEKVQNTVYLEAGKLYEFDPVTADIKTKNIDLYKPKSVNNYNYRGWSSGGHHSCNDCGDDDNKTGDQAGGEKEGSAQIIRPPFRSSPVVVGQVVQCKIDRVKFEANTAANNDVQGKAYGRILLLGKPDMDFVAWLPDECKPSTIQQWVSSYCDGVVQSIVSSNCGPSAWVKDMELGEAVVCYEGEVGDLTWTKEIAGSKCSKCSDIIDVRDALFTSVKDRNKGFRIHCAQCIINSLPEGEIKHAFIERRAAALQDREPIGNESDESAERTILLPHSPASA